METYKVAIIGCGSIGALKKDHIDFPGSENILTHCNSINRHPRTELTALIDTDAKKLSEASKKWFKNYSPVKRMSMCFFGIDTGHGLPKPDITIISVPTEHHYAVLNNVLKYKPRLIIAEKPFCMNYNEARKITRLYSEYNIPIMVDYIRRFAPKYQEIKKQIDSGIWGKALNCRILYTRGLKHEGCHAIDLMRYFFGETDLFTTLNRIDLLGDSQNNYRIEDRNKNDPSVECVASFEKCKSVIFFSNFTINTNFLVRFRIFI